MMPRKRRIWNPDVFNHVVMRGNNRQNIFTTERDFLEFYRTLHYVYEKYPFTIAAYCLMTNHYHLLLRSPKVPLSKIMRIINRRYSDYFRKKYNYTGHLYEARYYSEMVTTPMSMLRVSRYIHRNPINTNPPMVKTLENYPYSSYALFKFNSLPPYPFLNINPLQSCLQYPTLNSREDYCAFCETENEIPIEEYSTLKE